MRVTGSETDSTKRQDVHAEVPQREREREAGMVLQVGHNRDGMAQPVDRSGSINKHGLPKQWWLAATPEENFTYWISNC